MIKRISITTLIAVMFSSVTPAMADVEINWVPKPQVDWPFGTYRTCLGYAGKQKVGGPLDEYAVTRMRAVGQGPQQLFVRNNWSDAILNEQLIDAVEYTIEQCRLRKAGESFDKTCPLGSLTLEEAVSRVGADKDEFWSRASSHLGPLKTDQQTRFDALKPELVEACGP
ncbi:hypothetical protein [uncultured Ruegeria sp.]|uniref:hypothetical protein n=1 Tax=uncultured Ruegeria sp. TaxID=259304 RepID=UPI002624D7CC|nr:hypothetical protein [uncultured Ruegeria sp.]